MKQKDIALVYMVAGISKRFGDRIKAFACIGPYGETLIEYSLNQALPAGFSKIIFIVNENNRGEFRDFFGTIYHNVPVFYAVQTFDRKTRDKPWGTADALCTSIPYIDCPFIVCNGDDLYGTKAFASLVNHIHSNKINEGATIGYRLDSVLSKTGSVNRGIFTITNGFVTCLNEVLNITKENFGQRGLHVDDLCSMNIYAFFPEILQALQERVTSFKKKFVKHRESECYIPKELSALIAEGKTSLRLFPAHEQWMGITYPEDEIKIHNLLASHAPSA